MPQASPRKSSISYDKRSPPRPRYLGIEVAGSHPPPGSSHAWEAVLRARLVRAGVSPVFFRLIRSEGTRAVAEVDHRTAALARAAWEATEEAPPDLPLVPRRTWGTLVGAKAWLRRPRER
jgi:hypothetical protein